MWMNWILLLVFLPILVEGYGHPFMHLDTHEDAEKVRTCDVSGYVDRDTYLLHGELYNCTSPPMSCSISAHDPLVRGTLNIQCRIPSDSWLYRNDSLCSFRFYYRPPLCADEMLCYSMAITCFPVFSPTPFYWICVSAVLLLIVFLLTGCICFICKQCCSSGGSYKLPMEHLRRTDLLEEEMKVMAKSN